VAVRGSHHIDVGLDAFEPAEAVHRGALDRHLAFHRHSEVGEECDGSCEVLHDDTDVVHSLNRHFSTIRPATRDDQHRLFSSFRPFDPRGRSRSCHELRAVCVQRMRFLGAERAQEGCRRSAEGLFSELAYVHSLRAVCVLLARFTVIFRDERVIFRSLGYVS
jgi:hypothetical protein